MSFWILKIGLCHSIHGFLLFWELLYICFVCFIKCLIDVIPSSKNMILYKMNSIICLPQIWSILISFFKSSLNNSSTNATSLNIWWVLSTLACGSFVPKPFFFFLPVSCEKQFSTNYCHNMNKFKTENISTEYFQ